MNQHIIAKVWGVTCFIALVIWVSFLASSHSRIVELEAKFEDLERYLEFRERSFLNLESTIVDNFEQLCEIKPNHSRCEKMDSVAVN